MGDFTKAVKNLENASISLKELKNDRSLNLVNIELSKIHYFKGELNDSISFLIKGLNYFKSINDTTYYSESVILLSKVYRLNKNIDEAINVLNNNKIDNSKHIILSNIETSIINLIKDNT